MAQFLEASMLVCFGFSWPMSVYKNIKARTAKSMSLQFILLIILGYIAGIVAKICTHTINYVLVVYILNLVIVSANVVVYFINRKYDMMAESELDEVNEIVEEFEEKKITDVKSIQEIEKYERMNKVAKKNGIVFFGTNLFNNAEFNELAQDYEIDEPIYNRSLSDLNIECASEVIENTVKELSPEKIFVNLGETDLKEDNFEADGFIQNYKKLISNIKSGIKAEVYIVSVISSSAAAVQLNDKLKSMSDEMGCKFVNASKIADSDNPEVDLFKLLHNFMRKHRISFVEAINS